MPMPILDEREVCRVVHDFILSGASGVSGVGRMNSG